MATLATGLMLGTAFGLLDVARRYVLVPLGAMLGASVGLPLVFMAIPHAENAFGVDILFHVINPGVALSSVVLAAAALGLISTATNRLDP